MNDKFTFYLLREQLVPHTAVCLKHAFKSHISRIYWYLGRGNAYEGILSIRNDGDNILVNRNEFRLATIEDVANAYAAYMNDELDTDVDMLFETIKVWMQIHGIDKYSHAGYCFNLEPVHVRASKVEDEFDRLQFMTYESVDLDLGMKLSDKEAIAKI